MLFSLQVKTHMLAYDIIINFYTFYLKLNKRNPKIKPPVIYNVKCIMVGQIANQSLLPTMGNF